MTMRRKRKNLVGGGIMDHIDSGREVCTIKLEFPKVSSKLTVIIYMYGKYDKLPRDVSTNVTEQRDVIPTRRKSVSNPCNNMAKRESCQTYVSES